MTINALRRDCAIHQKKGLHFILASIIIWIFISGIHLSSWNILTKNFLTFCVSAPLVPIAYGISKLIDVDFTHKNNPLTRLGLMFSMNQILYLLIAMWIYRVSPNDLVMILAIIFGAHLLPYAWLYQSKSYYFFSICTPLIALLIGTQFSPVALAMTMIIVEVIFSCALIVEVKLLKV